MATLQKTNSTAFKQQTFPVLEMSCASCAVSVESILKSTNGVKNATVNFANQSAWVEFDQSIVKPPDLQHAVQSVGYDLIIEENDTQEKLDDRNQAHLKELKWRTIWASVFTIPVVVMAMLFMGSSLAGYLSMLFTAPVVIYFGRSFFVNAVKQLRHGKANMDTLVALSTGTAFLYSAYNTFASHATHAGGVHAHVYYESAAVIIVFILLGKVLEERAKSSTSSAIKKLMGLQPRFVSAIIEGEEKRIAVSDVQIGYKIVVKPGEKIPVDGIVTEGTSFVDESAISGEAMPSKKMTGNQVFAGSINQKGRLMVQAQKVGGDTVLAQIIKIVTQAQGSKAPVQKLVDKIAGIFVPVVMAIAFVTFLVWVVLGGPDALHHALSAAVTVLVIACPCALGLATPTALTVGLGKGAENHILVKDAESIEVAYKVNAIIFDKTGTITEGKPTVTDLVWMSDEKIALPLKEVLLAMERSSEHPFAEAVVVKLKNENVADSSIHAFQSVTGRGIKAIAHDNKFYVGNEAFMLENKVTVSNAALVLAAKWQSEGKTVSYFSDSDQVRAVIAVADQIKQTSLEAIRSLQKMGIEIYMLTGDNEQTAKAVAASIGIQQYRAQQLPGDKSAFITQLKQKGKIVAMVGDGINDSPALALADVSIAMGHGSDIALDVSKITLVTSDLRLIPKALKLSRKTVSTIRENLFWAFIYNIIGIPLAAGILYPINGFLLNPMIAGAAMALSSLSVVANSLRLKTTML